MVKISFLTDCKFETRDLDINRLLKDLYPLDLQMIAGFTLLSLA